jgi:hypothetical protein
MNEMSAHSAAIAAPSAARDAILDLKAWISKSMLCQDHLVESMLTGSLPTATS